MILYSHANGIHTARLPSPEPSVPGRLLASADVGRDGWFVRFGPWGHHLIYTDGEATARQLLRVVAEEVAG